MVMLNVPALQKKINEFHPTFNGIGNEFAASYVMEYFENGPVL